MKRTQFVFVLLGLSAVLSITGWIVSIRQERPLSPSVEKQAGFTAVRDEVTGSIVEQSSVILSPTNAEIKQKVSAEVAGSLAQKVVAGIKGKRVAAKSEALASDRLWDTSLSLKARCEIVWRLARSRDPSDFRKLTEYLMSPDGDSQIKAVIVESLGESPNPEARGWILSALNTEDEKIVRGALRGLAKTDNPDDIKRFSDLLLSSKTPDLIRAEAAKALGRFSSPEAGKQLIDAYNATGPGNEMLRGALIDGLSQRDIAETESFFRQILAVETNAEYRLNIMKAVSVAKGNTTAFFLDYLNDTDSKVRAESAWNMTKADGNYGEVLSERLRIESDPEVRQRLYEALAGQEGANMPLVLEISRQEKNEDVKLAAYNTVASHLGDIGNAAERERTGQDLVKEFERLAVEGRTVNQRLRAVIGLRNVQTSESDAALGRIVARSTDPRVIVATGIDLNTLITK